MKIETGVHGTTNLNGLRFVGTFTWPGPIHEGKGEAALIIDERATPPQREALLRIVTGKDTEPGATAFQVFSTTFETLHEPIFAPIEFHVDVSARQAKLVVPGVTEGRGEPIVNPVSGAKHRARIDLPNGFEYVIAEIGRGWTKTLQPIKVELADSYAPFADIHLWQSGVVR